MEDAKNALLKSIESGWERAKGGVLDNEPSKLSIGYWVSMCKDLY